MSRRIRILGLLCLFTLSATSFFAQSPCPTQIQQTNATRSGDLICLVPQVYGAGGLVGSSFGGPLNDTTGHAAHFQDSSINSFKPINSEIGITLSQLPLTSPSSGFIFSGGVVTPTESFGPVLSDRAETIGKHKLFIGASYQYFDFDKADGVHLRNFGAVFTHEHEPGNPYFTNDIIATENSIDLKVHQITAVATYGISDRVDVSVAIPFLDVSMGMFSLAKIYNFEPPPVNHSFLPQQTAHETYYDPYDALFYNNNSASGVGDIIIRGKFLALRGEDGKSNIALGTDLRLPTGDANNFLGSGAWGVRPFVTYTRTGRVSPHTSVGYEVNGNSILAGDITTQKGTSGHLPNILTYSGGADVLVVKRLSLTGDFIGETLLSAGRIADATFTDVAGNTHSSIASSIGSVNEENVSLGGKLNVAGHLLLTLNVLIRVNDGGLHSKPAPLVGLSYLF